MWGSSFADLAKKAQELQEHASSLSKGELFNLDAMAASSEEKPKRTADGALERNQNQATATPSKTESYLLPSQFNQSAPAVPVAPPIQPKGKLKMNIPSKAKKAPPAGVSTKLTIPSKSTMIADATETAKTSDTADASNLKVTTSKLETATDACAEQEYEKTTEKVDVKAAASLANNNIVAGDNSNDSLGPCDEKDKELESPDSTAEPTDLEEYSEQSKHQHIKESPVPSNQDEATSSEIDNKVQPSSDENVDQPTTEKSTVEVNTNKPTEAIASDNMDQSGNDKTDVGEACQESEVDEIENENQFEATISASSGNEEVDEKSPDDEKIVVTADEASAPEEGIPENPEILTVTVTETEMSEETGNFTSPPVESPTDVQHTAGNAPLEIAEEKAQALPSANPEMGPYKSDQVMQQFTGQLQRLEANFEAERKEIQLQNKRDIEAAVATKNEEITQLLEKMKEKDLKLRELRRIKEGNELRMDSLKREVEGIKDLLEQRDSDIEKVKKDALKDRRELEKIARGMEADLAKSQQEVARMKDELSNSKGELGATNDEYAALKSRVKVVAGELKDRRVECRDLKTKIEELEQSNEKLEDHISSLESQLSDRDRSGTEKDEEVNGLRRTIKTLEKKVDEAEKRAKAREVEFENNLTSYKKKAQNSLSVANSRAAAAIQAKEEAELEARAARSTADATIARARLAEENGQKAMKEAKEYYKEVEAAKEKALVELQEARRDLEKANASLEGTTKKLEHCSAERDTLAAEKAKMVRDLETQYTRVATLDRELKQVHNRSGSLQDEVASLELRLQKAQSEVAANAKKSESNGRIEAARAAEDATSKATIMMLQNQLKEANGTIAELREALQNAIVENDGLESNHQHDTFEQGSPTTHSSGNNKDNGVPLFYAMEKQAELNTARNEINRLASLYADVQSEKVEAEEALKALRKELDEEKSKLQRYEKLGSANGSSHETQANGQSALGNDPGRTNIEYLKNIMLSYLHAKTLSERKRLIPVIGAVLCLTSDEQAQAIENVQSTGGMEGFSSALFETLGNQLGRSG